MSDVTTTPEELKGAARRVKAKAAETAGAAKAAVASTESSVKAAAAQRRSKVETGAHAAKEWAVAQPEVIRGQVSERPLVAIGVSAGTAFAAGLVLGVLLTSRR